MKAYLWDFKMFPPQKIRTLNLRSVGKKTKFLSAFYDLLNIAS